MKRLLQLLFFTSVLALTAGCLGDRSAAVIVTNEMSRKVVVYPYGRDYAQLRWVLEPGASHKDNLPAGDARADSHVARIEAVDEANMLVFCHSYSYGELKQLDGQIRIREGRLDCK